jgi:predicted nucleic acid-binding protein
LQLQRSRHSPVVKDGLCPDTFNASDYPATRDEDDLPILVTAILEDVEVLISGDRNFTVLENEKSEILTPTEFIELYG